jgi:hypothetical protein
VGGGAMTRNVLKVGVMSGGQLEIIPRPATLGTFFHGITGAVNTVDGTDGSFEHTFTLSDQFASPWYTIRNAPGQLQGEQFADCKVASLALSWRAANFVRGAVGFQGVGVPEVVSMASWAAPSKVDGGPQFLAPLGKIELPTGQAVYVTAGSFTAGIQMPFDEQWVVGSYSPQTLSITKRAYVLSLAVKIEDAALYKKIMYDGNGGSTWLPAIFREASFSLEFASDVQAAASKPFRFSIAANGQTGADANVTWSAQPINMQAGRQLIMAVTGTFLASPDGNTPLTIKLTNDVASY